MHSVSAWFVSKWSNMVQKTLTVSSDEVRNRATRTIAGTQQRSSTVCCVPKFIDFLSFPAKCFRIAPHQRPCTSTISCFGGRRPQNSFGRHTQTYFFGQHLILQNQMSSTITAQLAGDLAPVDEFKLRVLNVHMLSIANGGGVVGFCALMLHRTHLSKSINSWLICGDFNVNETHGLAVLRPYLSSRHNASPRSQHPQRTDAPKSDCNFEWDPVRGLAEATSLVCPICMTWSW